MVLFLTPAQADAVRGLNAAGTALLEPTPYLDGYVLHPDVLDDPAHAGHHALLASLPLVEYVPPADTDDI